MKQRILFWVIGVLEDFNRWGWSGIYAYFFPVYWTQDSNFVNDGYDLLSLKWNNTFYFYGTKRQVKRGWNKNSL